MGKPRGNLTADPDISVAINLFYPPEAEVAVANRLGAIGVNQLTGRLQFFDVRASLVVVPAVIKPLP
jgi:hypothetical protein